MTMEVMHVFKVHMLTSQKASLLRGGARGQSRIFRVLASTNREGLALWGFVWHHPADPIRRKGPHFIGNNH